jgi:hypothetical protein
MRPISLPDELGNFATVQVDDQLYDTGQSAATLQQTYHAAAAIREYKNGEGQNTNRMVVTAVRTRLPSPPPVLTAKGAGYRQRIEPAGSDVWCVIDGEESVTTRCLKSTGVLSVEVKQNSQGARLRSAELAALTRAAFDQID